MDKTTFEDFTETEFLEFVRKIFHCEYETEQQQDEAIFEFDRLVQHPSRWDLIFHPDPSRPDTPEAVVDEIKAWRAANGKPGFKQA